ncbi:NUDIX hydrolase [Frankia sp. R43]|nr:NUDIX hydrolase [Frankia sp. R43]
MDEMPVSNDDIANTISAYLDVYPTDAEPFAALLERARGSEAPLASRATTPGHVTCGAVVVTPDRRVLQIRHRRLERWLLPGGHIEPEDDSLLATAMRELAEEAGISGGSVSPVLERPVDLHAHVIPANPIKVEPEHTHYDFRFLLAVDQAVATSPNEEEVSDFRWIPLLELPGQLGGRVRATLLTRKLPDPARRSP